MNTTSITELKGNKAGATVEETLVNADLNWKPIMGDVFTEHNGTKIPMPGKRMLFRNDNLKPLGVVGREYCPTDPEDFMKVQFQMAEKIGGTVERAGFIDDRSRMFAFVKMNNVNVPVEFRKKGDPVSIRIYSTDGWDGMTPRRYRIYMERLACTNGMVSRDLTASLWVSHVSGMAARHELRWGPFVEEIAKQIGVVREQFARLAQAGMDMSGLEDFLKKLLPGESKMTENRRAEVGKLFTEETGGIGTHGKTRWDAYNAVTQYVTHNRKFRGTEITSESTNRFLGVLETDTMNERALSLLLN
jgi:hypothetical protein